MQRKSGLLALFLFIAIFAWANPKDSVRLELRDGQKYIIHRVEKSESIGSLAARYGIDESQLLSANPLISDKVFPGQIVRIPLNANKYGNVSVPSVIPITDSKLPLAKSLPKDGGPVIPAKKAEASIPPASSTDPIPAQSPVAVPTQDPTQMVSGIDYHTYVAASPTNVQRLADLFFMQASDIIAINNLKNNNIKEGQKVRIPIYPLSKVEQVAKAPEPLIAAAPLAVAAVPIVPKPAPIVETPPAKPAVAQVQIYNQAQHRPAEKLVKQTPIQPAKAKVVSDTLIQSKPIEVAIVKTAPPVIPDKQKATIAPIKPIEKPQVKPIVVAQAPKPIVKIQSPATTPQAIAVVKKATIAPESDSMLMVVVKKQKRREELSKLDSEFVIANDGSYKLFDYKTSYEQPDAFTKILAEENTVSVNSIDQSQGVGNKNTTHVVKLGETIDMIARKYKINKSDIINWNGLVSFRVREGQELIINAERANISPYERTLPENSKKPVVTDIKIESIEGIAIYDSRKITRGVYANNIEKGKFVYIINKDNFREDVARVIGPLPKGTPENVIVILDQETAIELGVEKSWVNIELYFGIINDSQTN